MYGTLLGQEALGGPVRLDTALATLGLVTKLVPVAALAPEPELRALALARTEYICTYNGEYWTWPQYLSSEPIKDEYCLP